MKRLILAASLASLFVLASALPSQAQSFYYHKPAAMKLVIAMQTGGGSHSATLSWTASTSASSCVAPCAFGYNVFRGTATGTESATPINSTVISGLTYTDPITLTPNPQSFFYTVEAVETSGGVVASSVPSNEVSATFPGVPAAPVVAVPVVK